MKNAGMYVAEVSFLNLSRLHLRADGLLNFGIGTVPYCSDMGGLGTQELVTYRRASQSLHRLGKNSTCDWPQQLRVHGPAELQVLLALRARVEVYKKPLLFDHRQVGED